MLEQMLEIDSDKKRYHSFCRAPMWTHTITIISTSFFSLIFFDAEGYMALCVRARSRLYRNEFLQENMRLTAFFKIYKICILLHRCNLLAQNRFERSAIFVKIQSTF